MLFHPLSLVKPLGSFINGKHPAIIICWCIVLLSTNAKCCGEQWKLNKIPLIANVQASNSSKAVTLLSGHKLVLMCVYLVT